MKLNSIMQKIGGRGGSSASTGEIPPPVLGSPKRLPNGSFQFNFDVARGVDFEIQVATDLKNWSSIAKGKSTGEPVETLDVNAPKFSQRFYRIVAGGAVSINVIGYVSVTLPPRFSLISNPLDSGENTVSTLFKDWPNGTALNKFDTHLFKLGENSIQSGRWNNPTEKLIAGEGAIFFNPTLDYKSHCFVGEVTQGKLSMQVPSGFSIRSSMTPQSGRLHEDLEFPVAEGDVIHLFDRDSQKYVLYPFGANGWESGAPVLSTGEAFWVAKTSPQNWAREFFLGL